MQLILESPSASEPMSSPSEMYSPTLQQTFKIIEKAEDVTGSKEIVGIIFEIVKLMQVHPFIGEESIANVAISPSTISTPAAATRPTEQRKGKSLV